VKIYIDQQIYDATYGWNSYAYLGEGSDEYRPCHHSENGGLNDAAYITADDSQWTIDTPESPQSILALIMPSTLSVKIPPLDLRNTTVSFSLRGDNLQLHGATCYFWVVTFLPTSTRWHYTSQPLNIPEGKWSNIQKITLKPKEELWHCSFSLANPRVSLNDTLEVCISFGFSFVGFSEKVTGKLSLSEFIIHKNLNTHLTYSANFQDFKGWLALSRSQGCQIPALVEPTDIPNRMIIRLSDENYLVLTTAQGMTFMYLAFIRRTDSTKEILLHNSSFYFMIGRDKFATSPMDYKQGNLHFFLENTETNTIWILRPPISQNITMGILPQLTDNERNWFQLTGNSPLRSVIAGGRYKLGYDYMGLMLVGVTDVPTGSWKLGEFSISQQA
jgi:hypothetical protein